MAQLVRTPPAAGSRWVNSDLSELTAGSRKEHQNPLTAASRRGGTTERRGYEIQIIVFHLGGRANRHPGDAGRVVCIRAEFTASSLYRHRPRYTAGRIV